MADAATQDPALMRAHRLMLSLWNDDKYGEAVRAKAKELFPDFPIPDDTVKPIVKPMQDRLEASDKKIAELEKIIEDDRKARKEESENRTFLEKLDAAVEKFGLTAEGKELMLKRMKETGNAFDADAAAAWVNSQNPPPKPPGPSIGNEPLNLFGANNVEEQHKLLHTNPLAFEEQQIREMLSDPDKYVRETFGNAA